VGAVYAQGSAWSLDDRSRRTILLSGERATAGPLNGRTVWRYLHARGEDTRVTASVPHRTQ
jgi:hypothetical protein